QSSRAGYTTSSDVWSVGVILIDCLQGNYLFHNARDETDLAYLIDQVVERKIQFPYAMIPDAGHFTAANFQSLVESILVKDAQSRPSIAQVLNHAFFGDTREIPAERLLQ